MGLRGQAEPIAVIILTAAGLALALLAWSWVNSQAGPLSTQAMVAEYLAFERSREFATLIARGVDAATGYDEYVVELFHVIASSRNWFAFTLIVVGPDGTIDPEATLTLNQALANEQGIEIYLLMPSSDGGYVRNATPVEKLTTSPRNVVLYDGNSLVLHGILPNKTIVVVRVPEYTSGVGDPTPEADIDLLIDPALLPKGSHIFLVTLTLFDNQWYEVTRLMLS